MNYPILTQKGVYRLGRVFSQNVNISLTFQLQTTCVSFVQLRMNSVFVRKVCDHVKVVTSGVSC